MKKLKNVFSILVLTMFMVGSINVNGQNGQTSLTSSEVKNELIEGFAKFVESVRPFYRKGDTYKMFKRKVLLGTTNAKSALPTIPTEGENMLKKAYEYLSQGLYYDQIITKGDYKTIAAAVLFVHNQSTSKKGKYTDNEAILFGDNILVNNPFDKANRAGCKWWQLSCILESIFGEGNGDIIIDAIIDAILGLLK